MRPRPAARTQARLKTARPCRAHWGTYWRTVAGVVKRAAWVTPPRARKRIEDQRQARCQLSIRRSFISIAFVLTFLAQLEGDTVCTLAGLSPLDPPQGDLLANQNKIPDGAEEAGGGDDRIGQVIGDGTKGNSDRSHVCSMVHGGVLNAIVCHLQERHYSIRPAMMPRTRPAARAART